MKQKHIDMMREIRLWIRDLAIPAGMAVVYIKTHPEAEMFINNTWENFANKFRKNPKIKIYK